MIIIDEITTQLANWSLNRDMAKQAVTAQNIANANVQGYKALSVDFQSQLEAIKTNIDDKASLGQILSDLHDITPKPEIHYDPIDGESDVKLDQERLNMLRTASHYRTLVESLNRQFGLMQMAISGRHS